MTRPDHKPRPRVYAGKPFAHFQWNYGWGSWEQVVPEAAGRRGVVTAYAPLSARPGESLGVSQDEQTASLLSRLKEAERELANLREWRWSFDPLTLTHAMVVGLLAEVNDNDAGRDLAETLEAVRDNLTVAARDLQAAQARIKVLEGTLERIRDDYLVNHTSRWARDTARSALPQLGGENG